MKSGGYPAKKSEEEILPDRRHSCLSGPFLDGQYQSDGSVLSVGQRCRLGVVRSRHAVFRGCESKDRKGGIRGLTTDYSRPGLGTLLAMTAHSIIARSNSLFGGVGPSQDFERGGVPLKAQNYFHRLGPAAFQAVRLYEKPQGGSPAISICRAWLDPIRSQCQVTARWAPES